MLSSVCWRMYAWSKYNWQQQFSESLYMQKSLNLYYHKSRCNYVIIKNAMVNELSTTFTVAVACCSTSFFEFLTISLPIDWTFLISKLKSIHKCLNAKMKIYFVKKDDEKKTLRFQSIIPHTIWWLLFGFKLIWFLVLSTIIWWG